MNFQDLIIQTQREVPNNARTQGFSTLVRAGFPTRENRAGVWFNDAILIGSPVRITICERARIKGMVELKPRTAKDKQLVSLESLKNLTSQEQFWELISISMNDSQHPLTYYTGTGANERPAR